MATLIYASYKRQQSIRGFESCTLYSMHLNRPKLEILVGTIDILALAIFFVGGSTAMQGVARVDYRVFYVLWTVYVV